jgi:hypothetical protein
MRDWKNIDWKNVRAVKLDVPPNTGDRMEKVWVFISRDAEGRENVCGSLMGPMGAQPLMTGNPKILELMKPIARDMALANEHTGRTIHLICFSNREEIVGWHQ